MDTPLERSLEAALQRVGYALGPRMYADQIIAQAQEEDRGSRVTSSDMHLAQMPGDIGNRVRMSEGDIETAIVEARIRVDALALVPELSSYQLMVADERVPAFLRTATRGPWTIEYRALPTQYWKLGEALPAKTQGIRSESLAIAYDAQPVVFLVGGRETAGRIETSFDAGDREVLRKACRETGANYALWHETLEGLNGKPFEPQPIADLVAELVGGRP